MFIRFIFKVNLEVALSLYGMFLRSTSMTPSSAISIITLTSAGRDTLNSLAIFLDVFN